MQRQLSLDLGQMPVASFDNFLGTGNEELISRMRALPEHLLQAAYSPTSTERLVYVWGPSGSGRTHLLHALCTQADAAGMAARYLGPHSAIEDFAWSRDVGIYAVDDVERLDAAQQIALFNLFNDVRPDLRCALVSCGCHAPRGMEVREDLRTRLGWGLVYQVHSLSDTEKVDALIRAARERGLNLSADVPNWLLTHFHRDMPSLMGLLDSLDTYSLEQKRAVTLPLVRKMLAEMRGADGAGNNCVENTPTDAP